MNSIGQKSSMIALFDFLGEKRVEDAGAYTHTLFSGIVVDGLLRKGKFYISQGDRAEFERLYRNAVSLGGNPMLTEKRDKDGVYPVLVDLDFRLTEHKSVITDEYIYRFSGRLVNSIKKYVVVENPKVVVLRKPVRIGEKEDALVGSVRTYVSTGVIKEGIHLHVPNVIVNKRVADLIRQDVLCHPKDILIDNPIVIPQDAEKIYDKASVSNNWFLPGSHKGGADVAWVVDDTYTPVDDPVAELQLNWREESTYTSAVVDCEQDVDKRVDNIRKGDSEYPVDIGQFREVLSIMRHRADAGYNEWYSMLCVIANVCRDAGLSTSTIRELAHYFSEQSEDYDAKEVDDKVNAAVRRYDDDVNGKLEYLRFPTLVKWAKDDMSVADSRGRPVVSQADYKYVMRLIEPQDCLIIDDPEEPEEPEIHDYSRSLLSVSMATTNIDDVLLPWNQKDIEYWEELKIFIESMLASPATVAHVAAKLFGSMYISDATTKERFKFNGVCWSTAAENELENDFDKIHFVMLKRLFLERNKFGLTPLEKQLSKLTAQYGSLSAQPMVANAFWRKVSRPHIRTQMNDDASHELLFFLNGVVDLKTMDIRPARTTDMSTKSINYKHALVDDMEKQNKYIEFVKSMTETEDEAMEYIAMCALALTGSVRDHPMRKHHSLAFFFGKGDSGKTTINALTRKVFDGYAGTVAVETLLDAVKDTNSPSPAFADLMDLRFVTADEPANSTGNVYPAGKLKGITGGDPLKARQLYQPLVEFYPQMSLFISSNQPPVFDTADDAIQKRVAIFPMPFEFHDNPMEPHQKLKDPDLVKLLSTPEYLAQIMRLFMKTYKKLTYGTRDERIFPVSESRMAFTHKNFVNATPALQFFNERFEITNNMKHECGVAKMFKEYTNWKYDNEKKDKISTKEEFEAFVVSAMKVKTAKGRKAPGDYGATQGITSFIGVLPRKVESNDNINNNGNGFLL